MATVEPGYLLELLPADHLDGIAGLGQHVQASQSLDRAIDVPDGKGGGVRDVDL